MLLIICIIIAIPLSIALVAMKSTMIDDEGNRNTPQYLVGEDEKGNDVIRPLN